MNIQHFTNLSEKSVDMSIGSFTGKQGKLLYISLVMVYMNGRRVPGSEVSHLRSRLLNESTSLICSLKLKNSHTDGCWRTSGQELKETDISNLRCERPTGRSNRDSYDTKKLIEVSRDIQSRSTVETKTTSNVINMSNEDYHFIIVYGR